MDHHYEDDKKPDLSSAPSALREHHLTSYLTDATYRKEGLLTANTLLFQQITINGDKVNLILDKGQHWRSTSLTQKQLLSDYTESRGSHDYSRQQRIAQTIHRTSRYKRPVITTNDAIIRVSEDTQINVAHLADLTDFRSGGNKFSRTLLTFDDDTSLICELGYAGFLKLFKSALVQLDSYRCSYSILADYTHISEPELLTLIKERDGNMLDVISPLNDFVMEQINLIRQTSTILRYTVTFLNKEIMKETLKPLIRKGLLKEKDFPNIKF